MSTKHFINDAETLVSDCLESLTLTNPNLGFDKSNKAVFLETHDSTRYVTLISGGGAGHEPAHAGYVGEGLLTAAVSGNIFASPNVAQIVNTIVRVGGKAGVILIIKNYTGDIFHFYLAAEKARANYGLKVEVIVVGDDVSVGRERSGKVGRRGLAGTVFVHKVLGAMSKTSGANFDDLVKVGRLVASSIVTVGVSLGHVHIPGREISSNVGSTLQSQVEVGMGIHNESGCRILQPQPELPKLIDTMLDQLLNMSDSDRAFVDMHNAKDVVLMVNNLGSVSVLELGGITKHVVEALSIVIYGMEDDKALTCITGFRHIKISRVLSGTFMTSLDGPGFSITLLKATPDILSYIDAPATAVGWSAPLISSSIWESNKAQTLTLENEDTKNRTEPRSGIKLDLTKFIDKVSQACKNVIAAEPRITKSDVVVGDGDCGITLARGGQAVLDFLGSADLDSDALITLLRLVAVIEDSMDGTSGALYSIFFAGLASAVRSMPLTSVLDAKAWGVAAKSALAQLQLATPARQGDRTLMDALEPFINRLSAGESIDAAVASSKAGVEATKGMKAAFGRAVYVETKAWSLVPDPGAEGVLCLLEGLV